MPDRENWPLLGFDILPRQVYRKEIAHYLKQQNEFGLPLDNRFETTDAKYINFRARSVVGGVFMKTLEDYLKSKR